MSITSFMFLSFIQVALPRVNWRQSSTGGESFTHPLSYILPEYSQNYTLQSHKRSLQQAPRKQQRGAVLQGKETERKLSIPFLCCCCFSIIHPLQILLCRKVVAIRILVCKVMRTHVAMTNWHNPKQQTCWHSAHCAGACHCKTAIKHLA